VLETAQQMQMLDLTHNWSSRDRLSNATIWRPLNVVMQKS
jgi:hypothetical protein